MGAGVFLQILANLVMEKLLSELREIICPRLKGKVHDRHRSWTLVRKPSRVFITHTHTHIHIIGQM